MQRNFLELLSSISLNKDLEAEIFIDYILAKYLNNENLFVSIKTAIPLLEESDLEDFLEIIKRNK